MDLGGGERNREGDNCTLFCLKLVSTFYKEKGLLPPLPCSILRKYGKGIYKTTILAVLDANTPLNLNQIQY